MCVLLCSISSHMLRTQEQAAILTLIILPQQTCSGGAAIVDGLRNHVMGLLATGFS